MLAGAISSVAPSRGLTQWPVGACFGASQVKQLTGYHNLAKVTHKTYRLKSSEGSTELDVKVVHPQSWPWMLAWWVLYYP